MRNSGSGMPPVPNDPDLEASSLGAAINRVVSAAGTRAERARAAAEIIHHATGERWVGIYDVGPSVIAVLGWYGPSAPAYPQFSREEGLSGAAVRTRRAVVVGDVGSDPRYLQTLSDTRSEIVVPIIRAGAVCGTLDVESARSNAFGAERIVLLERAALALLELWPLAA
jgi:L-methionine (R)-S-oxide reductase